MPPVAEPSSEFQNLTTPGCELLQDQQLIYENGYNYPARNHTALADYNILKSFNTTENCVLPLCP